MEGQGQGEEKTLGKFSAIFLIANAAIGAGVLNFPEAFRFAGGAILAMILQVLLIMFVVFGLIALAVLTKKLDKVSMQDIMLETCGKGWHLVSTITIILYSFFCCVAYHIVIGDQFDRVLYNLSGPEFCHTWYLNRKFTIVAASTLLMLPFLFPKKIDFLKYISSVGVTAILYVIALVVVKYFVGHYQKGVVLWLPNDIIRVTMTLPPFCFAYHVHIQSVAVFWVMKDQSMKGLLFVCYGAMAICLALYSLTGVFGYMTFGSLVKSNILVNYAANDIFVIIAILIVALKICCVYPVVTFCGRDAVIDIYLQITKGDREVNNLLRRIIVATLWFILAVVLALGFPNIGVVIDVLGFFVAFFEFVFPGLALLKYENKQESSNSKTKVAAYLLLLLGVFIATLSISVAVWRLIEGGEEHQLLCR